MTIKAKLNTVKEWTKRNADVLVPGTIITAVSGAYIWLVYAAVKEANEEIEKYNEDYERRMDWIVEEANAGNAVYTLSDGLYLTVPIDAPQKLVRK